MTYPTTTRPTIQSVVDRIGDLTVLMDERGMSPANEVLLHDLVMQHYYLERLLAGVQLTRELA